MKKGFRRLLTLLLVACLSFGGVMSLSTVQVEAKAKPKLSATSVSLAMGGSKKITLKNGNGKWSISNTSVAAITKSTKKYATVVPKRAGTAVLTCKVGKKTLKCTVKVVNSSIGKVTSEGIDPDEDKLLLLAGATLAGYYELDEGEEFPELIYDSKMLKITTSKDPDDEDLIYVVIKPLKAGRTTLTYKFDDDYSEVQPVYIYSGFRGNTKVKKTEANYKKWRASWIKSNISKDLTTWEIIDMLGSMISTGKYSSKGGATGMQLWYGGNGTCVSGAKMMNDFLTDLGISSKVRFAGKDKPTADIFGYTMYFASGHKNVQIKLGGKTYILNPQPGSEWPIGIIAK